MAHTALDKFILMAKEQGLKFTFGSDNPGSESRLTGLLQNHCQEM